MNRNTGGLILAIVLSVVIAILGAIESDSNSQLFFVVVGISLVVTAVIGLGRVRTSKTDLALGAAAIQHNWITLSVSLAFLSLVPAEFFGADLIIKVGAGVSAGAMVLVSLVLLLDTRRATGVDLSI